MTLCFMMFLDFPLFVEPNVFSFGQAKELSIHPFNSVGPLLVSSPEHKVLRVSYCDRPLSAVRRLSCVNFLCPRHSKNCGGALSVTPVRSCVRSCVRPSVIKIWYPLNNFWKTTSIQFKFGMLIYNIKTQVKFDFSYNPLIFDGVMGLL